MKMLSREAASQNKLIRFFFLLVYIADVLRLSNTPINLSRGEASTENERML